jgi:hypothetical protein
MKTVVIIRPSPKKEKKFRAIFEDGSHVDFGQKGYSDFTLHKDPERMHRYVQRHGRMGETWTIRKGLKTAGFWSRWFLWSKPSLTGAKKFMESKFNIVIKMSTEK